MSCGLVIFNKCASARKRAQAAPKLIGLRRCPGEGGDDHTHGRRRSELGAQGRLQIELSDGLPVSNCADRITRKHVIAQRAAADKSYERRAIGHN